MSTRSVGWSRSSAKYIDLFTTASPARTPRAPAGVYVRAALGPPREERRADRHQRRRAGPRTLQEFLSQHRWDDDRLRDRLQHIVARRARRAPTQSGSSTRPATSRRGTRPPASRGSGAGGWARPRTASSPSTCAYAREDFHCLLDGELYLPESWDARPRPLPRGRHPRHMTYRPKWKIALELYDRAMGNGLRFDWLTFDEGYGSKPELLRELTARGNGIVAEVPRSFTGWLDPPRVITRPFHK